MYEYELVVMRFFLAKIVILIKTRKKTHDFQKKGWVISFSEKVHYFCHDKTCHYADAVRTTHKPKLPLQQRQKPKIQLLSRKKTLLTCLWK